MKKVINIVFQTNRSVWSNFNFFNSGSSQELFNSALFLVFSLDFDHLLDNPVSGGVEQDSRKGAPVAAALAISEVERLELRK